MADLMLRFEAIGIDCQFGAVQRCCGVEPLGLFRFTASSIDNLTAVIGSDLADFLTPDDLALEVRAGEYMVFSHRYNDFSSHTNVRVADQDAGTVAARQSRKAAYLKKRFKLDWRAAERIYVHCGCDDEAAVLRLHAALRKQSECWLLWVSVAEHPKDRGRVELRGPGFLKGHLAHHGGFDDHGFYVDLPGWASVCRMADAIVRGSPQVPPACTPSIDASFTWASARCGSVECGLSVGRCVILHDCHYPNPAAELTIAARLEVKGLIVVSLWVRLSPSFHGRHVVLTTKDAFPVNYHRADISVVDGWQQVWLVMRVPEHRKLLTLSLDVEASRSSEIVFGGWQIELGGVPGEDLKPSEDTVAADAEASAKRMVRRHAPRIMQRWIVSHLRRMADRFDPQTRDIPSSTEDSVTWDILRLSNLLMDQRRFDEADAVLLAGRSLYPWRPELYSHYGLSARLRADVPMAAVRWAEVINNFPQYAYAHYQLAGALRELGETQRALAVIEAALPRHLDDPGMVSEAARVFATAHRWPEALAAWERAFALAGDKPEWRDARAHAAKMAARFPPAKASAINA